MPDKLIKRYNHLQYNESTSEEKGFVDFLYENTELSMPDVDVDDAWNSFERNLNRPSRKSYGWLRIAASIVVLMGVSFFVWNISTTPELINVASEDQKINVTFPDGSTGILNKNSSFAFLEEFGKERKVSFDGEAFFDIQKSEKPFVIEMNGVDVQVLGTAFNLNTSETEVELYVERGLVAFSKDGEITKVEAGLKAVFDKKSNSVEIVENPSANISSWTDGILEFDDATLGSAVVDLERHYGISFKLENEQLSNCRITVSFQKTNLKNVIRTLETMLGVEIKQETDLISISGSGC